MLPDFEEFKPNLENNFFLIKTNETPPGGYRYNQYVGISPQCVISLAKSEQVEITLNDVFQYTAQYLYNNGFQDYVEIKRVPYEKWKKIKNPRTQNKKLLICAIISEDDILRGLENLRLNNFFLSDCPPKMDCVLFVQAKHINHIAQIEEYINLLNETFNVTDYIWFNFPQGDFKGFPFINNKVFSSVAEYVFLNKSKEYSHFINFESDVLGLRKCWIHLWWEFFLRSGKDICGYIGEARNIKHMNGMAIWPSDIIQRHPAVSEATNTAWDLSMRLDLIDYIHPANDFYVMQWNTNGYYLNKNTSTIHNSERPVMSFFDTEKILIHGCKDLTINRIINERISKKIY